MSEPRTKAIYVMGAGRSGSTILGVALGNCEGVFFAGELDKWFARDGAPRREGGEVAAFWAAVRERLLAGAEAGEVREVLAGRTGWLERSTAPLDPRKWRERRRLRARYRAVSAQLYDALAAEAGATVIVDTSHYPLRARELQAVGEIELYLVWLVRDPHSVVASLGRRDVAERHFGVLAANAYLFLTHLVSALVFARQPPARRLLVRHEGLLADPRATLARITELVGHQAPVPDLDSLRTGVPFHGNRLVLEPVAALHERVPAVAPRRALTRVAQAPWRLVFRRYTAASR